MADKLGPEIRGLIVFSFIVEAEMTENDLHKMKDEAEIKAPQVN